MKDNVGENVSLSKKQDLNNRIVLMRKCVRTGKVHVINKLSREVKKLKLRKGDDKGREKAQRKAEKYINEIHTIRKLNVDTISRFALQNKIQLNELLLNPNGSTESRAIARLAFSPPILSEVEKYRKDNPYWEMQIEVLLQRGRSVKQTEYEKMKEERMRKKEQKRKQRELMGNEKKTKKDETVDRLLSALKESRDEDEDITVESQSEDSDEEDQGDSNSEESELDEPTKVDSEDEEEEPMIQSQDDEDEDDDDDDDEDKDDDGSSNEELQTKSKLMFKDKLKTDKNEKFNKEKNEKFKKGKNEGKLSKLKAKPSEKKKFEKKPMNLNKIEGEMKVKQFMNLEDLEDDEDVEEKSTSDFKTEKNPRSSFFVGGTKERDNDHQAPNDNDDYNQERKFQNREFGGFRGRGRGDFRGRGRGEFRGDSRDRGFSRGDRGFSRGDRGFSRGDRGFSRGDRGFSRGDRGFSRGDRGFSRGDRGFSRGGRNEFRGQGRGFDGGFNRRESNNSSDNYNRGGNRDGGFNRGKERSSNYSQLGQRGGNRTPRYFDKNEESSNSAKKPTETLHPSWEAKKKQTTITAFQGKKIKFDD